MGNKVCILCVPVKGKKKVRRKPSNSSPTFSSITLSSIASLNLDSFFLEANASTPLPINDKFSLFTCQICYQKKPLNDSFNVEGCPHFYCIKCIVKYIVYRLKQNELDLMCPVGGCSGVLNPHYCKPILPNNVLAWWEKALCESVIPEKEKFYCPYNDCSVLLFNEAQEDGKVIIDSTCPHCERSICVQCKTPWHQDLTCDKFQRMQDNTEELLLYLLAKRRNWKQCPNCRHYVEKKSGCDDMRCRLINY
ncbi:Zinc finger, RING-type [Sesbania bispinosa]|nr:Zinc finger, RING-type [Sesbania bispinosa]